MDYLARTRAERRRPRAAAAGLPLGGRGGARVRARARTIRAGPPVSRYARGGDYHDADAAAAARRSPTHLREAGGPSIESRAAVDTSAVLERDLAARAGLGWIGKNTNLIAPGGGSYFFIGIVLTTAALAARRARWPITAARARRAWTPARPSAFVGAVRARRAPLPGVPDHRAPRRHPRRVEAGDAASGSSAATSARRCARGTARRRRRASPRWRRPRRCRRWRRCSTMDDAAFRARFRGSAMSRAKRAGLARNAALLLGNRGDRAAAPALQTRAERSRRRRAPGGGVGACTLRGLKTRRRGRASTQFLQSRFATAAHWLHQPSSHAPDATSRAGERRKEPAMPHHEKQRQQGRRERQAGRA